MSFITKYIDIYKKAPKLRKGSMLLLLLGLALMPITSLLAIHAMVSFETIMSSIKVPNQLVSLNIDIDYPDSMSVIIAYSIYNPSIFLVSNLQLGVEIRVNYIDKYSFVNITRPIYSDQANLPDCKPFQLADEYYIGFYPQFLMSNLVLFNINYDTISPVNFFMDISFSGEYLLSLIMFNISYFNLNLDYL